MTKQTFRKDYLMKPYKKEKTYMDWFVLIVGVVIGIGALISASSFKKNLTLKYGPLNSIKEKTDELTNCLEDQKKKISGLNCDIENYESQRSEIQKEVEEITKKCEGLTAQCESLKKEVSMEQKYAQFKSVVMDIAAETSEYYQIEYANLLSQIKSEFSAMFYVLEAEKLKSTGITLGRNAAYITSAAKEAFSDMNRKFASLRNRLIDIEEKYFFQKIQTGSKKFSLETIEQKFGQLNDDFGELKESYQSVGVNVNINSLLGMARKLYEIKIRYFKAVQREKEEMESLKIAQREAELLKNEINAANKRIEADISKTKIELKRLNEVVKSDPTNSDAILAIHDKEDILISLNEEIANNEKRKVEKAGWVYVISNPMNDGIFKIGTTRRMNPQDRIDELASASVPFDFMVHSVIYSQDCFEMETALHDKLHDDRVNKVNMHKEFFYSTPSQLKEIVLGTDPTAAFVESPKCEEFDISTALVDNREINN